MLRRKKPRCADDPPSRALPLALIGAGMWASALTLLSFSCGFCDACAQAVALLSFFYGGYGPSLENAAAGALYGSLDAFIGIYASVMAIEHLEGMIGR